MSDEKRTDEEGAEQRFQSAGELLAQERQSKNLTIEQVSDRLKISEANLKAMEADQFEQLPGPAFSKGYLRSYARLLDINEARIMELYGEAEQADVQVSRLLSEKPLDHPNGVGNAWLVGVFLVIVAGFVGSSIYWWNSPGKTENAAQDTAVSASAEPSVSEALTETPQEVVSPEPPVAGDVTEDKQESAEKAADIEGADIEEAAPSEQVQIEPASTVESVIEEPVASVEEVAPDTTTAPVSATLSAPKEDRLVVRFNADCWVEVRDGSGKVLFSDIKTGQSELSLAGQGPLDIKFGNFGAVSEMLFNGKSVTKKVPVSRRGIGRVTLG